jgi:hypothetical protein
MSTHHHAIVWIDHHQARVFHFGRDEANRVIVHPKRGNQHIHHKANTIGSGHAPTDKDYLRDVGHAVADAEDILISGPAGAKTELVRYLEEKSPDVRKKVVAVETLDHPTDGQLLDHARRYFGRGEVADS